MKSALIDSSEDLIDRVLTAATNVHRELGPGLLESVYERALMIELADAGIRATNQVEVPAIFKGKDLGLGFRADVIVEDCLLLELKCVDSFSRVHLAQILNYLRLLRFKKGFLLNFNLPRLKDGIQRLSI